MCQTFMIYHMTHGSLNYEIMCIMTGQKTLKENVVMGTVNNNNDQWTHHERDKGRTTQNMLWTHGNI